MAQQKQIAADKLQLMGFSAFNIPSISQFPNMFGDSLKFITTDKNIGTLSRDFLDVQHDKQLHQHENSFDDDSLAMLIQKPELNTSSGKKKRPGCTCKKTLCLKMYCQCFANNRSCNEDCVCCDCKNSEENQQLVEEAKGNVKEKGLHHCSLAQKRCNCKKSSCQKKYCQCFNAGVACSAACRCQDCCNNQDTNGKKLQSIRSIAENSLPQLQSGSFLQKSVQNLQNL